MEKSSAFGEGKSVKSTMGGAPKHSSDKRLAKNGLSSHGENAALARKLSDPEFEAPSVSVKADA